jgi:hypothetical protein
MPKIAVEHDWAPVPLNMRAPRKLRQRLERAARQSGRSLTAEVTYRVERAFDLEEMLGGDINRVLFETCQAAIRPLLEHHVTLGLADLRDALIKELNRQRNTHATQPGKAER